MKKNNQGNFIKKLEILVNKMVSRSILFPYWIKMRNPSAMLMILLVYVFQLVVKQNM